MNGVRAHVTTILKSNKKGSWANGSASFGHFARLDKNGFKERDVGMKSSEAQVHRWLVAINRLRLECGWTSAEMNEHIRCSEEYQPAVWLGDLSRAQLFRVYKDLCELRKFQKWREKEMARRLALEKGD